MSRFILALVVTASIAGTSFVQPINDESLATCYGNKPCRACKNCKYCKHCAKGGGTCGVCSSGEVQNATLHKADPVCKDKR